MILHVPCEKTMTVLYTPQLLRRNSISGYCVGVSALTGTLTHFDRNRKMLLQPTENWDKTISWMVNKKENLFSICINCKTFNMHFIMTFVVIWRPIIWYWMWFLLNVFRIRISFMRSYNWWSINIWENFSIARVNGAVEI